MSHLFIRKSFLLFCAVQYLSGQSHPPIPAGLWQNKEEGFVIRIEACGDGLCGFAAGAPKNPKKNEGDVCGKQMLKSFAWNEKAQRWEGPMQPPNTNLKLNSSLSSDGKTYLVLKGKVLLVSKTMNFVPYTGKIAANCRLE